MLRQSQKLLKNYQTYYIYRITNPSGAKYIGLTTNIEARIKTYSGYNRVYKNQTNLYKSIEKYSWTNHKLEIIKTYSGDFNINELNDIEQGYIMEQFFIDPKKTLNTIIRGVSKEEARQERDI